MPLLILSGCLLLALLIMRASLGNVWGEGKLELGFGTTAGRRQLNADETGWACYREETMLAIADGIGSGSKGQTAAQVAVHTLTRVFGVAGVGENPLYFFRQAFQGANASILRYIPDATAGASVLCAVVRGGKLYYALAGNCRLAVYRGGELIELSEGHSLDVLARKAFQRRELSRDEAVVAAREKRVYHFVGKDGFRELELYDTPVALKRGDILVLTTDGVHEFCSAAQLEKILSRSSSCSFMARQIVKLLETADSPEQDNASVILARVNAL